MSKNKNGSSKRRRRSREQWQALLTRFESAGLSVAAFCAGESISEASFYRWKGLLASSSAGHRLAQRPGSYVILKYVRPVIKRRDTEFISCPPAPVGVIEGSRADVSFVVGLVTDKFCYHQPLYRQHQRLADNGIKVSRPWLTQLTHAALSLLEAVFVAQLDSIRTSRVKAMDDTLVLGAIAQRTRVCSASRSRPAVPVRAR